MNLAAPVKCLAKLSAHANPAQEVTHTSKSVTITPDAFPLMLAEFLDFGEKTQTITNRARGSKQYIRIVLCHQME